ncbi:MAG TPA: SDR family oxidoreductase [Bryobacteraceae bacterium]|nr:SDR family oxidoreductase [Bryobacteraceae bacterium]
MRNPLARRRRNDSDAALLLGAGLGAALGAAAWYWNDTRYSLKGQVALIAGASRGLGLELAEEFARQGCSVVICARNEEELGRARASLESRGARVFAIPCDVGDREQVQRLVSLARARFGSIDILCNVAGIIQVGPIESMTAADFEEAMKVMFWGTVYPTLEVLPAMMARQRGRIVNITSIGGKVSVPHLIPYNCAKFAAVAFSEGLNAEMRAHNVKVVTIVPGLMRTGSFLNAFFKGRQEREFNWFGMGATMPGISMNARRAARQIVAAARRGQSERVLSKPAQALALLHGVFPGLTAELMAMANSLLLPVAEGGSTGRVSGTEVSSRTAVGRALRVLGGRAARRLNQVGPKAA